MISGLITGVIARRCRAGCPPPPCRRAWPHACPLRSAQRADALRGLPHRELLRIDVVGHPRTGRSGRDRACPRCRSSPCRSCRAEASGISVSQACRPPAGASRPARLAIPAGDVHPEADVLARMLGVLVHVGHASRTTSAPHRSTPAFFTSLPRRRCWTSPQSSADGSRCGPQLPGPPPGTAAERRTWSRAPVAPRPRRRRPIRPLAFAHRSILVIGPPRPESFLVRQLRMR